MLKELFKLLNPKNNKRKRFVSKKDLFNYLQFILNIKSITKKHK